jgi:hypothetical protein
MHTPTGAKGDIGAAGADDATGATGAKGDTGADGATGATGAQGLKGDTGAAGATGADGATGAKGDTGAQGAAGATGAQGAKGDTGATGANGPQGFKGDTGATGATGPQGANGTSVTSSTEPAGANCTNGGSQFTAANGTTYACDGSQGATGAPGATGAKGNTGLTGATGPQGATGPTGPQGPGSPNDVTFVALSGNVAVGWTNQPAATTELYGFTRNRTKVDLTAANQCRFLSNVSVQGAASSQLRVQYSMDQSTWIDLPGTTISTGTTGLQVSTFTNLPAGAKQDVFLRVVGQNGDGNADPAYGSMSLQVK